MFDSRHKNISKERHRCTKRGVRLKIALKRSGNHIWFNIYEIYGGKESHCHPRTFLSVLFQHPVQGKCCEFRQTDRKCVTPAIRSLLRCISGKLCLHTHPARDCKPASLIHTASEADSLNNILANRRFLPVMWDSSMNANDILQHFRLESCSIGYNSDFKLTR